MFSGLFFLVVGIVIVAIWVWTLLVIFKSARMTPTEKLVWILLVIFFPFLGTLLYVAIGRKR
jgi:hypothetical protein